MERSGPRHSSCLWFQMLSVRSTLYSPAPTINTMVAIFLAKVKRAISGWMPLGQPESGVARLLERSGVCSEATIAAPLNRLFRS